MTTIQLTIPFSGFYETVHSDNLQRFHDDSFYVEELFQQDIDRPSDDLHCTDLIDYKAAYAEYGKRYSEELKTEFLPSWLPLNFVEVDSPREYNFETDLIVCETTIDAFRRLLENTDKKVLSDLVAEKFTSREGFASFYSNDFNERLLQGITEWRQPQYSTVLEAYILSEHGNDDFHQWELYSMDDHTCNGFLDDCLTPRGVQLNAECYDLAEKAGAL